MLGIGSPFGADTLGWQAIDHLERSLADCSRLREMIDTGRADRPGLRLLELIRPYSHVILVDAVVSDAPAGRVHHLQKDALLAFHAAPSTHAAGICEALALGAAVGELPADVELFGLAVEPEQPVPQHAVAALAAAVLSRLRAIARRESG